MYANVEIITHWDFPLQSPGTHKTYYTPLSLKDFLVCLWVLSQQVGVWNPLFHSALSWQTDSVFKTSMFDILTLTFWLFFSSLYPHVILCLFVSFPAWFFWLLCYNCIAYVNCYSWFLFLNINITYLILTRPQIEPALELLRIILNPQVILKKLRHVKDTKHCVETKRHLVTECRRILKCWLKLGAGNLLLQKDSQQIFCLLSAK